MWILIFVVGAALGSFLNVVIYRLPRGESLLYPPSRCPKCGHKIEFYDNIPILSYILLRGKCRYCGAKISLRYPIVEGLTAILLTFLYLKFGISIAFFKFSLLLLLLMVLSFIDLDLMILPNKITIPGIFTGILLSIPEEFFVNSLIGAISGYLAGLVLYYGGAFVFRKDAFGGGDVKLLSLIGAFMGIKGLLLSLFLGSIAGSIVGVSLKKKRVPFGPFLAIGALIAIFYGKNILSFLFSQ